MPISGNATTTRINRPTNTGGDELHETLLSDGSKAPRVVAMDDEGNLVNVATDETLQSILAALATLDGGAFAAPFTGTNGDVVTLNAAMPIAQPGATLLRAVNNTGLSLATVIGLVVVGGDVTMPVRALAGGVLTLPTATWDAVTGGSGGLIPGAAYYLGSALGVLTTTAPSLPGLYVTPVGTAISAVTLLVDPQPPILL